MIYEIFIPVQPDVRPQYWKAIDAAATGPALPLCSTNTPLSEMEFCTQAFEVDLFDLPFDPRSIMHYKNGA